MTCLDYSNSKNEIGLVFFTGFDQPKDKVDGFVQKLFFENYGLNQSNMHFFVSPLTESRLRAEFGMSCSVNFYDPLGYSTIIPTLTYKCLIVVVAGHSGLYGVGYDFIDSSSLRQTGEISPTDLVNAVNLNSTLDAAVLILGGCLSGTFNFLNTKKYKHKFCIVGSTGFHNSLNSELSNGVVGNVFLFFAARWFDPSIKKDVDGDGLDSIMDCYKYAGTSTAELLKTSRTSWYLEIKGFEHDLSNIYLSEEKKRYLRDEIQQRLSLIHTYQEPWILNANDAREIIF